MNYKKITACAAALCLIGGNLPFTAVSVTPVGIVCAADLPVAYTVTLDGPGMSVPVTGISGAEWSSDNESIATVDSNGVITSVGVGTANVYATIGTITLRIAVVVNQPKQEAQIVTAETLYLSNSRKSATIDAGEIPSGNAIWKSDNENVAVVSKGEVTAVGTGTCNITMVFGQLTYIIPVESTYDPSASDEPQITETRAGAVTLTNINPSVQVTASATDGMTVEWSSTDTSVATVDSTGLITAVNKGNCRVYAKIGTTHYYFEVSSNYDPSVGIPETVLGTIYLTNSTQSQQITLQNVTDGAVVVWSSSDGSVAEVNQGGFVTARGEGSCKITALVNNRPYVMNIISSYGVSELAGDANCDNKVSLADSVAVLQYIANKDKYPLSAQGALNADVYGKSDGITGQDALAIQQYDSGMISSLPV